MNLLKALVLLPTVLSLDCPAKPGPFQVQPQSYRGTGKASRSAFEKDVLNNREATNKFIPPICDGAVRVATYNVHYHKCLHAKNDNTVAIRNDLISFNPSVIVFQEVVATGSERASFEHMLQEIGYNHRIFKAGKGAWLGNMIASKIPLSNPRKLEIEDSRVVVIADFEVDGSIIAVLGTHLEVGSAKSREQQTKMIMDYIGKEIAPKYDQYILTGDMNAHWDSNEIQALVKSGELVESFAAIGAPVPNYTCWAGTTIDFVFASKALSKKLIGSYVYQTESSDHLPVLVDLKLSKAAIKELDVSSSTITPPQPIKDGDAKETNWRTWIMVFFIILVIVIAAAAAYFYFRQRSEL